MHAGPSCRAGVATISLALRGFELQPAKQPPTSNVSRCQARFSLPMTGGAAANYDEVGQRTLGTVVGAPKVRPLRAVRLCSCAALRRAAIVGIDTIEPRRHARRFRQRHDAFGFVFSRGDAVLLPPPSSHAPIAEWTLSERDSAYAVGRPPQPCCAM